MRASHDCSSKILHEMKIHDYGISPLLMQNSYSKLIFDLKMLSVDEFNFFEGPISRNWDLDAEKTNILLALQQSKLLFKNSL